MIHSDRMITIWVTLMNAEADGQAHRISLAVVPLMYDVSVSFEPPINSI